MEVDERDFCATYDPVANYWTAAWKWAENKEPNNLTCVPQRWLRPSAARPAAEHPVCPAGSSSKVTNTDKI
ncbi:hypothetical protein E2C01_062221 [Portunus trituberculatus]|uniref:Uncharacterized protein n=1 Tax=Portunus trituberculatus TaxID=210409 RepID=A0A5B7H5W2_PORTR|nr:hypothetical protein [Portunus trituberculatus]